MSLTSLLSLAFFTLGALGAPQIVVPCRVWREYNVQGQTAAPNKIDQIGGHTCISHPEDTCQIEAGHQHSVGIATSITVGVDFQNIFKAAISAGFTMEWSTQDATTLSTAVLCPKGSLRCGLQSTVQMVKTFGKTRRVVEGGCGGQVTSEWENFHVEAPLVLKNGPNHEANIAQTYESCLVQCQKEDGTWVDGCKASEDARMPICPEREKLRQGGGPPPTYKGGWCTGHIQQYQRPNPGTDKYRFSVDIFDADKKLIGNIDKLETDNEGRISMTSRLPWTFEITSGKADENFVGMCYSDQCWQCDDSDGGGHSCTLGNGKNFGYEDGNREGDFGFTC